MASIIAPAPAATSNHEPAPAGNHVARCVGMVQIGTISDEFKGEKKELHKVRITWELPYELKEFKEGEGEKPQLVSKVYTLSMYSKATLRAHLEAWRGKSFTDKEADAFDILKLLGVPCMVNVMHATSEKGNTYAKVSSLGTLPKGMACPEQILPSTVLTYDEWNWDVFNALPEFIRKDIESTPEYKALTKPAPVAAAPAAAPAKPDAGADDADLPF